jgi:asparagine synthase (glutamine-hydrolysing)
VCGLVGVLDARPDDALERPDRRDLAEQMLRAIAHRGPDDSHIWSHGPVVLAHARLSILDLTAAAAQPMRSTDGRYALVFNGEIYNYTDLRTSLTDLGRTFTSSGDTEVLLQHIEEHGLAATLPILQGDWALALWDQVQACLFLARDRHGVKPLYVARLPGGRVLFGSELKAFNPASVGPEPSALNAMMLGASATWGSRTVLKGVASVRPGHVLRFSSDAPVEERAFASIRGWLDRQLQEELRCSPEGAVLDRVGRALELSLDQRMQSDAPVGFLASGGVDSSLLAAIARRRGHPVVLYHADVVGDSERPAAEQLARHLGAELHVRTVTDEDFVRSIAAVTWANDLPLTYHLNSVPFFLVSEIAAADGMKVMITGEGSDEYFVGYPQYSLHGALRHVDRGKAVLRRALRSVGGRATDLLWPDPADDASHRLRSLVFAMEEELVLEASTGGSSGREERMRSATLSLAQQHLLSLLHRNDRLGMAWGLESRFPFLGEELALLAVNLPAKYKLRTGLRVHDRRHPFIVDKWCIRQLAHRELPPQLAHRPKKGFPVSVYQRLHIDPAFWRGGYLAQHYTLDERALRALLESSSPLWATRLMLIEVWGRLFQFQQKVQEVEDDLVRQVTMRPEGG